MGRWLDATRGTVLLLVGRMASAGMVVWGLCSPSCDL